MTQYRQGDVFIESVDSLPEGLKPLPRNGGRVILALGESTGHAHAIADPDVELWETPTADAAERWLHVGEAGAVLRHEEHGPLALEPGVYRVRYQREWSDEMERRVVD